MKLALIFLIVLGCLALEISGLRCYNCKANNSDQCKHVKNLEIEDCAQVSETEKSKDVRQACSKIILEEGKHYNRGCVKLSAKNDYCEATYNDTKDVKCYFCDSNLCNGSGKNVAQLVALAFAVLFFMWF